MSKSLLIDPRVIGRLKSLPKDERVECLLALCELPETFGRPHVHSGLGIRKVGSGLFGCRGNVSKRFLFQNRPGDLFIFFLGNHDEVRAFLESQGFLRDNTQAFVLPLRPAIINGAS